MTSTAEAKLGKTAIVVGAGMAGLSAATALAGRFAEVLVLDRDTLPEDSSWRMGAGQGAHLHQLLKAGEQSLEKQLPGITQDFYDAGAVDMRVGRDVKVFDFGGWMDECDAGFSVTSLSRPAYESVLRKRVSALPGVTIRHETDVARLLLFAPHDGAVGASVELADDDLMGVEQERGERKARVFMEGIPPTVRAIEIVGLPAASVTLVDASAPSIAIIPGDGSLPGPGGSWDSLTIRLDSGAFTAGLELGW